MKISSKKYKKIFVVSLLLYFIGLFIPVTSHAVVTDPANITSTNAAASTVTSPSFTPSTDALIIVSCAATVNNSSFNDVTISDSFSDTITWTEVTETTNDGTNYTVSSVFLGTGWSSGSGTVTCDTNVGGVRWAMIVDEATGHDTSSPVSESNTGTQSSGTTMSVTLGSIDADNKTYGFVTNSNGGAAIAAGSGETELAQISSLGTAHEIQTEWGSDTSLDWTGLENRYSIGIAIEIEAAAAAGTTELEQVAYSWLTDDGSLSAGLGANTNQGVIATEQGSGNRLRLLLHVSGANLGISGTTTQLQVATRTGATCGDETFENLGATGFIRFFDGSAGDDGDNLTANTFDPRHSTTTDGTADIVNNQDYEESGTFTNSVSAISLNEDGLWDFNIQDHSAPPGTTYCFRAVQSGGGEIGAYEVYPQLTTRQNVSVIIRGNVTLRNVILR